MSHRDSIHQYITSLEKYLSRLKKSDSDEVIKEIESHIYDALELQEQNNESVDVQVILEGFGEPRTLATHYVDHILQGTPPPKGFNAIQTVKKGVTQGLYYSTGFAGFSFALFLLAIAILKIFLSDDIGVWLAEHGNSVIITFHEHPHIGSKEILGHWIIPVTLILSAALSYLTYRLLQVLKHRL
jgi:hypothetical protein